MLVSMTELYKILQFSSYYWSCQELPSCALSVVIHSLVFIDSFKWTNLGNSEWGYEKQFQR